MTNPYKLFTIYITIVFGFHFLFYKTELLVFIPGRVLLGVLRCEMVLRIMLDIWIGESHLYSRTPAYQGRFSMHKISVLPPSQREMVKGILRCLQGPQDTQLRLLRCLNKKRSTKWFNEMGLRKMNQIVSRRPRTCHMVETFEEHTSLSKMLACG